VSKRSRFKQGAIDPKTCKKLYESKRNDVILYQSGLELQFIQYCEAMSYIKYWANEPFAIKYISRLDNSVHEYFPDFIIENTNGRKAIVETKPYNQTIKPGMNASLWAKETWIKNCDKWRAAKEWAKENNMDFMIVTEKFFG
jgi:hypothetical protein